MIPPKIEESTKEERRAFVIDAWKCLHDCELCGKCRVLKGRMLKLCMPIILRGSGHIWMLRSI